MFNPHAVFMARPLTHPELQELVSCVITTYDEQQAYYEEENQNLERAWDEEWDADDEEEEGTDEYI